MIIKETLELLDQPEYYLDAFSNVIHKQFSNEAMILSETLSKEDVDEINYQYVSKYNLDNYSGSIAITVSNGLKRIHYNDIVVDFEILYNLHMQSNQEFLKKISFEFKEKDFISEVCQYYKYQSLSTNHIYQIIISMDKILNTLSENEYYLCGFGRNIASYIGQHPNPDSEVSLNIRYPRCRYNEIESIYRKKYHPNNYKGDCSFKLENNNIVLYYKGIMLDSTNFVEEWDHYRSVLRVKYDQNLIDSFAFDNKLKSQDIVIDLMSCWKHHQSLSEEESIQWFVSYFSTMDAINYLNDKDNCLY